MVGEGGRGWMGREGGTWIIAKPHAMSRWSLSDRKRSQQIQVPRSLPEVDVLRYANDVLLMVAEAPKWHVKELNADVVAQGISHPCVMDTSLK
mmetsp:Transcript_110411/g.246724  ORF Transcript_110411/g.246724 Transcript_110411/m.246724 type:complete len:93 (+) Transcript_110411:149-427(+)